MPAAQGEKVLATLHVAGVPQPGMAWLQLQLRGVRRLDHRPRVDRHAVFHDGRGFFHGALLSQRTSEKNRDHTNIISSKRRSLSEIIHGDRLGRTPIDRARLGGLEMAPVLWCLV